jgi:hypothetical protein
MSFRFFVRDNDGTIGELVGRVRLTTPETAAQAEEGAVGQYTLTLDDTFGTFTVRGHRIGWITETEALADAYGGVVAVGYTGARKVHRGEEQSGAGREWVVDFFDVNTLLDRRILEGADCKRGTETDIVRVRWLLSTSEMRPVVDDDTYVAASGGVAMDAADYVGQKVRDVLDDCAQQSGRNFYLFWLYSGDPVSPVGVYLWYDRSETAGRVSGIRISNIDAEIDDADPLTQVTFVANPEAELTRDPARVFSGIHEAYDGGSRYVTKGSTATRFAARDTTGRAENVKTPGTAIARARRTLNDIDTELDLITDAIVVPRSRVNAAMHGDLVAVHYEHLDGYEDDFHNMRVVERTVRELGPSTVELALTLTGDAPEPAGAGGGTARAVLWMVHGTAPLQFAAPGDTPPAGFPVVPTSALITPGPGGTDPWAYTGWTIEGTGTIDLYLNCPVAGVSLSAVDVIVEMLHNGAVIGSDSRSYTVPLRYIGFTAEITVTGLSVSPGDTITARVRSTAGVAFLGARGIVDLNQRMEITGGSLS